MASTIKVSRWVALPMIASLALVACGGAPSGSDDTATSSAAISSTDRYADKAWNDAWSMGLGPTWLHRSHTEFYFCATSEEFERFGNKTDWSGATAGINAQDGDCGGRCRIKDGDFSGACRYEYEQY